MVGINEPESVLSLEQLVQNINSIAQILSRLTADIENGTGLLWQPSNALLTSIAALSGAVVNQDLIIGTGSTSVARFPKGANNSLLGVFAGNLLYSTVSSWIDAAIGSTQGQILYRSATAWTALAPTTSGLSLTTQGAAANPIWALTSLTTGVTGTLPILNGGTGQTTATLAFNALSPLTTRGDILFRDATNNVRLGPGTLGQYLKTSGAGADPVWADTPSSFVLRALTASGTYTPTAGTMFALLGALGGGGGGGGVAASAAGAQHGAGGGGAGSLSLAIKTAVQIGASQVLTVGASAAGGTAGANPGTAGNDSSIGALVVGKGGGAGAAGAAGTTVAGGAGGVAGTGDVTGTGGRGLSGVWSSIITTVSQAGQGGVSWLGGGGAFGISGAGGTGLSYGGGGGGAHTFNASAAAAGGAGGAGLCFALEFLKGVAMTIVNAALVNDANVVVQRIVYDTLYPYPGQPGLKTIVETQATGPSSVGYTWNGTVFVPPPPLPPLPLTHADVDRERDRRNHLGQELFLKTGKVVNLATATREDFDNINYVADTALTLIARTEPGMLPVIKKILSDISPDPTAPIPGTMTFRDFYRRPVTLTYHEAAEMVTRVTDNVNRVNQSAHLLKDMAVIPPDYTDNKYWPTIPTPPLHPSKE